MSHRFLLFSWLTSVLFWEQHTLLLPSDEWRYKGGDFSDLSQWQDIGMRELSETPQVIQSAPCQGCNKAGHWHLPDSTLESSSSAHPSPFFLPSRPLASSSRLLLPNSHRETALCLCRGAWHLPQSEGMLRCSCYSQPQRHTPYTNKKPLPQDNMIKATPPVLTLLEI